MPWTMINRNGQRKYLTKSETAKFMAAAKRKDPVVYAFCWMIAATGCRISEALSLTANSIDFESQSIIIESMKKRDRKIFRSIPLPGDLLQNLEKWMQAGLLSGELLWPWSRMTGYRRICEVMSEAGIEGAHASPKGLRHGFGVSAIQSGVPLNLVQRWLGHADMKTTAIYTNASGPEEREIAARMWRNRSGNVTEGDRRTQADRRRPPAPAEAEKVHSRALFPIGKRLESVRFSELQPADEVPEKGAGRRSNAAKSNSYCSLIRFWLFCISDSD